MRISRLLTGAALLLICGGCVTSDAERRAADEARCRSYGFRAPSEAFSQCLLELDLDRAADRRYRFDSAFGGRSWYYGRRW